MIKPLKADSPKTPVELSSEARKLWVNLASEYAISDAGGLLLLATALEAFDRLRMAQKMIKDHGPVVTDKSGGMKPSPAIAIERDSRAGMLGALRALHLAIEPLRDRVGRPGRG